MNKDKIKDQFHYFNIQADIDSVYGNWAVSTDGDVVNCLYPYAILAIHFKDTDWMSLGKHNCREVVGGLFSDCSYKAW